MTIDQNADGSVWGAPHQHQPRWGTRETLMAVGVAVIIAALGGAVICAATGSRSQPTFGHGAPDGPPPGGFSAQQLTAAQPALHGEIVVDDGKGGFSTMLTQTGAVISVTSNTVTVRSTDSYTQTYESPPTVATGMPIAVDDEVSVQGTRTGQVTTLTSVNARTGPGSHAGPPGPVGHNSVITPSGPVRP